MLFCSISEAEIGSPSNVIVVLSVLLDAKVASQAAIRPSLMSVALRGVKLHGVFSVATTYGGASDA